MWKVPRLQYFSTNKVLSETQRSLACVAVSPCSCLPPPPQKKKTKKKTSAMLNAALKILFFEMLRNQNLVSKVPSWYSPVQPKPLCDFLRHETKYWNFVNFTLHRLLAGLEENIFPLTSLLLNLQQQQIK